MQISTVNNTFNIKIFAWKKYLVCKFRGKKPKSSSVVWHSGISGSKCPCSVAQLVAPSFVSLQLPFGVSSEQWANVEYPDCLHCNLTYFPGGTLGTPVKTSFSSPSPPPPLPVKSGSEVCVCACLCAWLARKEVGSLSVNPNEHFLSREDFSSSVAHHTESLSKCQICTKALN